jgi:hypothetical protein
MVLQGITVDPLNPRLGQRQFGQDWWIGVREVRSANLAGIGSQPYPDPGPPLIGAPDSFPWNGAVA